MIEKEWEPVDVFRLDDDFRKAFEKLGKVEALLTELPGFDCGICGAPSCRAFAEDVANGKAKITDCLRLHKNAD